MDNFSEQLNSLKNILNSTNNNLKNRAPQSSETKLLNSILNQLEKEHNERVANEKKCNIFNIISLFLALCSSICSIVAICLQFGQ